MSKKFYITTPIYYPSARPHLGHAYCTTMCDIIARGKRLRGFETFFLTGLDEHGEKIQKNATAAGITPQEFVDNVAVTFKNLWKTMKISNDDFIRTTEPRHVETVQKIFSEMIEKGDIYLSSYTGWYCVHEESYWTETQVGEEHLCPECHRPVEKKDEPAYFYSCSKHVDSLLKLYNENPKFITPEGRKTEMVNNFIKPGLLDLCVSRTTFSWGIPVNEDPKHVVYVWLDALTNYITALGYKQEDDSNFKKFWEDPDTEIVHVVGADITRFHTIYWPMFLESLGLRQPSRVFVHGLLMMKDGKMSKSKGNVIYVEDLVNRYGVDAVRYFMCRNVIFGLDGEFTPESFIEAINVDLANNFGNLVNRTISMINKYYDGVIPSVSEDVTQLDKDLHEQALRTIQSYEVLSDDLKVTEAYQAVMNLLSAANKYIQDSEPWALAKDESKAKELASCMNHLAHIIFLCGILLSPILVEKAPALFDQLNIPSELRNYESAIALNKVNGIHIEKASPLFPRLNEAEEIEYLKEVISSPKEKAAA